MAELLAYSELVRAIIRHAYRATETSLGLETAPGFVWLQAKNSNAGFARDSAVSPSPDWRIIRD